MLLEKETLENDEKVGDIGSLYKYREEAKEVVIKDNTHANLAKFIDYDIAGPDKQKLFRFPWSINDNPIAWVEVTDKCNIYCNGCYRNRMDGHKTFEEIKNEILFMKRWRNVDNVYLAGGEPLIHPKIVEIVQFITDQKLKTSLISNGQALDKELLKKLKKAGACEISFHVDSGQIRKGWSGKDELELIALRQNFVDLLKKEGKVKCNFNMTVSKRNVKDVPETVQWVLDNRGKVGGLTIITLRGALLEDGVEYYANGKQVKLSKKDLGYVSDKDDRSAYIYSSDVYKLLKTNFKDYEAAAYLGGTQGHTAIKWLISISLCSGNKIVGALGPNAVKIYNFAHHLFKGNYSVGGNSPVGRSIFFLAPFDKGVRKVFWKFLARPWLFFKKFYGFTISIVQPPDILENGNIEMCDSCPDLTLYKGELVNSCRLDEVRLNGALMEKIVIK